MSKKLLKVVNTLALLNQKAYYYTNIQALNQQVQKNKNHERRSFPQF